MTKNQTSRVDFLENIFLIYFIEFILFKKKKKYIFNEDKIKFDTNYSLLK